MALPTRSLSSAGGILWPGLHLIIGPPGSGKTQFLTQTATQTALLGMKARLHLPDCRREEAALRVAAVLSGVPWGDLEASGTGPEHLDRLQGAPFMLDALEEREEADSALFVPDLELLALDRVISSLSDLRRTAILGRHVVLLTLPGDFQHPEGNSPLAFARAFGLTREALAEADSAWVLVPELELLDEKRGPSKLRVGLAKSRKGRPSFCKLAFDGARFEDAPSSP